MNSRTFSSLCAFAGEWAHPYTVPRRVPFSRAIPDSPRKAVYVVCDWAGAVIYVGSTTVGVGNRARGHASEPGKTHDWSSVWMVPLADETPPEAVRRVEGLIGRAAVPSRTELYPFHELAPNLPPGRIHRTMPTWYPFTR